jgi:hypothetical protein
MNRPIALLLLLLAMSGTTHSQDLSEIVVTGSMIDERVRIPATSLRRHADFLLLEVVVSNDSRDYRTRRSEIYATLRDVLATAQKDKAIELSVLRDETIVLPLKLDDATLNFKDTGPGGTLRTTISVKTRIESASADAAALIAKLKEFVASIKPTGRTTLVDDDETRVSVVNIAQYREPVVQLFAEDVKKTTAVLGGDYRVVISGLDRPIEWVRSGTLDVLIFVPYTYDVVPTSISSYSPRPVPRRAD